MVKEMILGLAAQPAEAEDNFIVEDLLGMWNHRLIIIIYSCVYVRNADSSSWSRKVISGEKSISMVETRGFQIDQLLRLKMYAI